MILTMYASLRPCVPAPTIATERPAILAIKPFAVFIWTRRFSDQNSAQLKLSKKLLHDFNDSMASVSAYFTLQSLCFTSSSAVRRESGAPNDSDTFPLSHIATGKFAPN